MVRTLRRVAAVGLWWQFFAWEWGSLDGWDVAAGYSVIVAGLGVFLTMIGFVLVPLALPLGLGSLVLALLLMVSAMTAWWIKGRPYQRRN